MFRVLVLGQAVVAVGLDRPGRGDQQSSDTYAAVNAFHTLHVFRISVLLHHADHAYSLKVARFIDGLNAPFIGSCPPAPGRA